MFLDHLILQNFRSYSKSSFTFNEKITIIVGPNTSGKTNIIEGIFLLSRGKSFRADKDLEMIKFKENLGRICGVLEDVKIQVLLADGNLNGQKFVKKFLVNEIPRRRVDFCQNLKSVLFNPEDLEIIINSPSLRRNYLDDVLEQVDREYAYSSIAYSKALRQRNALLERTRETGIRNERQLEYWDELLIKNGQVITEKRKEFIDFINNSEKEIFDFEIVYDKSEISKARLHEYSKAEIGAGVTLVGPHRDDFYVLMKPTKKGADQANARLFGSRGQQRLIILQLKLLQIIFMEKNLVHRPLLLLDDIFSELDEDHINLVLEMIGGNQTIITTTHKEFIRANTLKKAEVIELKKVL